MHESIWSIAIRVTLIGAIVLPLLFLWALFISRIFTKIADGWRAWRRKERREAAKPKLPRKQWEVVEELNRKATRGTLEEGEVLRAYMACPARHKEAFRKAWGEPLLREERDRKVNRIG